MPTPSFDDPLPHRSVMPPQAVLNALSAVTFVALVVPQVLYWPWLVGSWLPSLTLALATPLLAFVPSGVVVVPLRRREARVWAAAYGFTHHRRPDWPLPFLDVAPFDVRRARRRRVVDGMTGRIGTHPVWQVHYRWLTNNRINVATHHRNVFGLTLPRALPPLTIGLTIRPDAGRTVVFESIDFNDRWFTSAPDHRFARALITPTTMDRLLSLEAPIVGNTRILLHGRNLLAISTGGNRGADITRIYSALRIIAEGIPPSVWDEWSTDDPSETEPEGARP